MKTAKIVVLAGQSNAVGVGWANFLPKHYTEQQVQKFYDGYSEVKINYFSHYTRSHGFVHTTVGRTAITNYMPTVGPDLGIAQWLTEHPEGGPYFIVKCAIGGSNLYHDWLSPSGGTEYDADAKENRIGPGWCYNELICLLRESIVLLEEQGYAPTIHAFCWMQGESDAEHEVYAKQYAARYQALISDFKQTFAVYTQDCVYLDGGISQSWAFHDIVNEGKKFYATSHKNCVYIDTIGAGLTVHCEPEDKPDLAHYDSESCIRLGTLFAQCFYE